MKKCQRSKCKNQQFHFIWVYTNRIPKYHWYTLTLMSKTMPMLVFMFVALSLSFSNAWAINWLDMGKNVIQHYDSKRSSGSGVASFSSEELEQAFTEALSLATEEVVVKLGQRDGFLKDSIAYIPLPSHLQRMDSALSSIGLGGVMDDLEVKLNRAAERATPKARQIFMHSIKHMSFTDVQRIFHGGDHAATEYFKEHMGGALKEAMHPVVDDSIRQVGALRVYDQAVASYQTIPFVPDLSANLSDYVLDKALQGMFYYMAKEEEAIRRNPLKRGTELLQRVFGS